MTSRETPEKAQENQFFRGQQRLRWKDVGALLRRPLVAGGLLMLVLVIVVACLVSRNWQMALNAIVSLVIGVTGSVVAAQIYASVDERLARDQLNCLFALGSKEYIDSWASEMQEFGHYHCEDFYVRVKLTPYQDGLKLFICEITYEYRRDGLSGERRFTFRRNRPEHATHEPMHTPAYLRGLFDWESDERSFPEVPEIAGIYSVSGFTVDSRPLSLHKTDADSEVIFSAQLPNDGAAMARIAFTVTLPIERESVLTLTTEFPTKDMRVELDWQAVEMLIEKPHAQLHFANRTKVNETTHGANVIRWTHTGWVAPKNGVTFVWWQR